MTASMDPSVRIRPALGTAALASAAIAALLALWAYWPTLAEMAWRWSNDPQYSHGYLVPAFAAYLLWLRRGRLQHQELRPALAGLLLLLIAVGLRLGGAYFHYAYLDQVSLLPCLAGIVALAGGRAALAWAWPALAFLAFMVPLPHTWSLALSGPMQTIATYGSTFLLQALGRPAIAEGNVIQLNEIELGIVEACSGLRMLVVFFALSTAVAILIRKPYWEKALIAASAVPIALVSNILRITVTGLVYEWLGNGYGGALFHDVAGWLMMPLGLIFLGLELLVLKRLLIEPVGTRRSAEPGRQQRVEVNPVAMYRGNPSRRERRTVTVPPPQTAPAPAPNLVTEPAANAPPDPAPESVSQS
jgi:exosortase